MRPETLECIEKTLKVLEVGKEVAAEEEKKLSMDEFMFCLRNCYTVEETERHVTNKLPSLKPSDVREYFEASIARSDQKLREAYLKDAEDCALQRRMNMLRLTSEEAKNNM